MVRGYYVFKEIWSAEEGEVLRCVRETNNHYDPYAVVLYKSTLTAPCFCAGSGLKFKFRPHITGRKRQKFLQVENFYVYGSTILELELELELQNKNY